MKLGLLLLPLLLSIGKASDCCLCDQCEVPRTDQEHTLVIYDGVQLTCYELALLVFSEDSEHCSQLQATHRDTCCTPREPFFKTFDTQESKQRKLFSWTVTTSWSKKPTTTESTEETSAATMSSGETSTSSEDMPSESSDKSSTSDESEDSKGSESKDEDTSDSSGKPSQSAGTATESTESQDKTKTVTITIPNAWSNPQPVNSYPKNPSPTEPKPLGPVPSPPEVNPIPSPPVPNPTPATTPSTVGGWTNTEQPPPAPVPSSGVNACTLCRDGRLPKNPSQGVVVGHATYSFTGSCLQLFADITSIDLDHPMCKVTQAQFDWTCGCNPRYVPPENQLKPWGNWNW